MDAPIPKADKVDILANEEAPLGLEGQRDDLDDPRGYGNCFVSLWKWMQRKVKRG